MMMSLFSIFDPCTMFLKEISWMIIPMSMLIIPMKKYLINNFYNKLMDLSISYLLKEFFNLLKKSPMILLLMIMMFVIIFLSNVLGLFPYIFNSTSSLSISLSLSLMMWLSGYMVMMIFNFSNMLVHLIPQGTSLVLMPFMVIIEMISMMIRPITLAIRLSANMMAGHLLMSLISNSMESDKMSLFFSGFVGQTLLTLLESAVAMIQSYVFLVLIVLYSVDAIM